MCSGAIGLLVVLLVAISPGSSHAQTTDRVLTEPRPVADTVARGVFRDGDPVHRGSGKLEILRAPDGTVTIRLEAMQIVPGPNLFVYLVKEPDPLFPEDVTAGFTSLGKLKSRSGNQNYELPENLNIDDWGSVVVRCDTFRVQFAVATIEDN
jgi:hypothetical protein